MVIRTIALLSCVTLMGSHYETFESLEQKSHLFHFPTQKNLIRAIAGDTKEVQEHIAHQANATYPIADEKIGTLISEFLAHKRSFGSKIEHDLYQTMTIDKFINRLLTKRPLMFMTDSDTYLLVNAQSGNGGFESIGTEAEKKFLLRDYISYDEMAIAALLGVSTPTYFINNGNRNNKGIPGIPGTFESEGVYVGLVGARFEKPGYMEWQHMIITPQQNTLENGYGKDNKNILSFHYGQTFMKNHSPRMKKRRMIQRAATYECIMALILMHRYTKKGCALLLSHSYSMPRKEVCWPIKKSIAMQLD